MRVHVPALLAAALALLALLALLAARRVERLMPYCTTARCAQCTRCRARPAPPKPPPARPPPPQPKPQRPRQSDVARYEPAGKLTYYYSTEDSGAKAGWGTAVACRPGPPTERSVAMIQSEYDKWKGRRIDIPGHCMDCIVEDTCTTCENEYGAKHVDIWKPRQTKEWDDVKDVTFTIRGMSRYNTCQW